MIVTLRLGPATMGFERHHFAWIAASLITVASFIGATAYTQNRLTRLDSLSSTIETNAVPSVEHLSRAAVRLARLNQLMDEAVGADSRRASARQVVRQEVAALAQDVEQYLQLPPLAGERTFWAELQANVNRAVHMVEAAVSDEPAPASAAAATDERQLDDALDAALRSVLGALDFDVRQAEAMARDVRSVRATTLRMIVELDALATVIALGAVALAFRAMRRHDELLTEHNALLMSRVTELDRFAGRVAHDILSPLGTIATGLSLLASSSGGKGRTYIERSLRALRRVQQLVDDLLAFARAGAHPDPAAHSSLDAVLSSVVADSSDAAAEAGIELVVDVPRPIEVPCGPGVITSIVQNLVRNGIKYMGARTTRTIVVRALTRGDVARLEVEDTGPGVPPEIEATLFEPFVRGPHEQVGGTGLGLATVKRLVESHHGRVGVQSRLGVGTLFWVELPLLPTPRAREPHADHTLTPTTL
jgi:signal transduction histidine kinase